ncbi:alkylated DNA repair protein alkB homolog 8 [Marchantia polymorpha subsp. ruderalis]|uniref:Fe2OG dioxygenase domain-containing protein n=2 Tax=Marchantia polymorpha TaxID=3197 RepID=A0AAF6BFL5_MARPO|nr:hypothetical protein MARPO_0189s0001 [Marchantia polymorpha]BBN10798.1 hypothetical protein Mp_5g06530 [Marchantia polymorpha subsp. ruderalis]PTQ27625.1 hypothetical protein MARPO_0189s0001 [Marchantia polymorpha]PTQ27626.1 hypothetical protein MARPO_0189s0001 [Marchantia polymorpha]BBN10799.1 hypothetical protein Mp_5g06530 [Marchantia polymorpha subsp. ruderalis]|eukprot:PTQ27624.1 hypothetical protein MARPO_0189s0001 [Marchantia polymorpha]
MDDVSSSTGETGGFTKPRPGVEQKPTAHLFVANCGPAVGLSFDVIKKSFSSFGPVAAVHPAGDSGTRVVVSFEKVEDAVAAKNAWNGHKCDALQGRIMFMQFSVFQPPSLVEDHHPVMTSSAECGIPGLQLYPDFVSEDEEKRLLAAVDQLPWQVLAKRRVQHFGYEFLYKSRNVDLSQRLGVLPPFVDAVVERLSALPELTSSEERSLPLDQLTVNEYPRGIGLSPHIDTHSAFEGSIMSLSLAGPCAMEFRRYMNASKEESGNLTEDDDRGSDNVPGKSQMERRALLLPARSLVVLSDEARYVWHHYIPHHKIDYVNGEIIERGSRRVSFTFRKVRHGPCHCKFVQDCDSQVSGIPSSPFLSTAESEECLNSDELGGDAGLDISDESSKVNYQNRGKRTSRSESRRSFSTDQTIGDVGDAQETRELQQKNLNEQSFRHFSHPTPDIEKQYVHKVYDAIAPHFSSTRFAKWPKVAAFLDSLAPGSIIADSGCGNGKYLGLNPKCYFIGCDISPPLVAICSQRGHEALVADALHLPYRSNFYDAAISIAVLHHLSSDQRRIRALEELVRVVRPGGKVLITVWAVEQEDSRLVKKWTPLEGKYTEEWVADEDVKSHLKKSPSSSSLNIIQEGDGCEATICSDDVSTLDIVERDEASRVDSSTSLSSIEEQQSIQTAGKVQDPQQEYFVPWHLPYHRAEVNGASVAAVASGFARKDDKKGAVVYDRYYHVFAEGELERLTSKVKGAVIVDQFYDKSNWCVILQKA